MTARMLTRGGGTCPVCGITIDRRAKACNTHAKTHLTPDHQRGAATARWEKEHSMEMPIDRSRFWGIEHKYGSGAQDKNGDHIGWIQDFATAAERDAWVNATIEAPYSPDSDRTAASYDNRADLRMIAWRQWVDRPEGDHTYHAPAVIKRYGNYD